MIAGSNLEQVLASGQFAVTGELGPPKSGDPEVVRKKARILKGHVDAVNITDCQTAIVRMSSLTAGLLALSEGVEPVMQMTCRDRNRIGIQAEVLGASALGIRNLLCLTGDHQKFGNHPQAKGVFDMDSIQLLGMIRDMRDEKRFQCGEEIRSHEPRLFLGAAANPFADPFEYRPVRLAKKVNAGANFIQTQIIYNVDKFARFMELVRDLGVQEKAYILAGVTPPKSLGMARYMKKFVPGLDVTDDVIARLSDAKDQKEEGIDICVDIINQVREIPGVAGVHVMAIEWEEAVAEIVSRSGLDKRPEPQGISPELIGRETLEIAVSDARSEAAAEFREELDQARGEARASRDLVVREKERLASEISRLKTLDTEHAALKAELKKAKAELETVRAAGPGAVAAAPVSAAPTTIGREYSEGTLTPMERQALMNSVGQGLKALRKALGLNEEQYEALRHFLEAEFLLHLKETGPPAPVSVPGEARVMPPAPVEEPAKVPPTVEAAPAEEAPAEGPSEILPPCPPELTPEEWKQKWIIRLVAQGNVFLDKGDAAKAEDAFSKALDLDPANVKAKAGLERAEAGEVSPPGAEAPAPEAEKAEPEPAPVKAEEVKPAPARESAPAPRPEAKVEPAPEKPAKKPAAPRVPAAGEVAELAVPALAPESASLMERAGSIPESVFIEKCSGAIRETTIGDGDKAITVGGESTLPFHTFEGEMPHAPKIAFEVVDIEPEGWPEVLTRHYSDVLADPVAWARKCVDDYNAQAICLSLQSTDPNGINRPSDEAAKNAAAVVDAVDVPVTLWGCGNAEKDTETLREVTALIGNKKVCLGPLTDGNYRALGATAMAFQLPVVASTPIDVNLAKQLNILLEDLGVSLNNVVMDPSIGAVGYGIEYSYSVMERIRLAALTQQDDKLQVPFICNLGQEVWKAKECRLPSDDILGDQERRGIMMEAVTASVLLMAGGELMVMRHPRAVALTEALIQGMM